MKKLTNINISNGSNILEGKKDPETLPMLLSIWLIQSGIGINVNRTTQEKCGAAHASCLFASYDEEFNCFDDIWHLQVLNIV